MAGLLSSLAIFFHGVILLPHSTASSCHTTLSRRLGRRLRIAPGYAHLDFQDERIYLRTNEAVQIACQRLRKRRKQFISWRSSRMNWLTLAASYKVGLLGKGRKYRTHTLWESTGQRWRHAKWTRRGPPRRVGTQISTFSRGSLCCHRGYVVSTSHLFILEHPAQLGHHITERWLLQRS